MYFYKIYFQHILISENDIYRANAAIRFLFSVNLVILQNIKC